MKKQRGITLVALIITIIIMLILVAVSVNVIVKSNLIGTAEKAADGYKTTQEKENSGTIKINGKEYASVDDYISGNEYIKSNIAGGTRVTTNTKYTIEGESRTAEIPAGFTVSGISGERTIEKGLVIYDIPAGTTVDWTKPDSVRTAYNQFVWIPVEVTASDTETSVAAFARSEWEDSDDGGQRTTGLHSMYIEPYSYNDADPYNDLDYDGTGEGKTGIASQIAELTKSIKTYGGFWIGRYEAGSTTERIKESAQNDIDSLVIQQDKYPYNCIKWGTSMGDVSTGGAVYLCNNLYTNKTGYGVKSMLCTGAAWDSMLDFIKDSIHSVTDSTTWGNYYNSETYKVYRGSYATYNATHDTLSSFSLVNTTEGTEVTKDSVILLTTGATERNSNKNLYDVAGNCYEWTTEVCVHFSIETFDYSSSRVLRGGSYDNYGSDGPASSRSSDDPAYSISYNSFRPLLYIKELDVNA